VHRRQLTLNEFDTGQVDYALTGHSFCTRTEWEFKLPAIPRKEQGR